MKILWLVLKGSLWSLSLQLLQQSIIHNRHEPCLQKPKVHTETHWSQAQVRSRSLMTSPPAIEMRPRQRDLSSKHRTNEKPGCEDSMNKMDTKTRRRGNRVQEGKRPPYHTVLSLTNRAPSLVPKCAANHLHSRFHPSAHATRSVWNTLSSPQSGAILPSGPNMSSGDGDPFLQWLCRVAPSPSLVWSSPMPRL